MKIGFIGLGNMGLPMAENLLKAGHDVAGFDTASVVSTELHLSRSAQHAVAGAEVIVTMLPNGRILNAVYEDVLGSVDTDALLIDCSTVNVYEARSAAELAGAKGIAAVDAPVSGGVQGAEDATLTFMVGGAAWDVERARPVLEFMGKKIVNCGGSGGGQAAKVCNNMLLGISMLGVCEAFALADRLSLDRESFFEVASAASGSCWSLNTYCPAPGVGPVTSADRNYEPGFAAELMLKDLELSQQSAYATNAPTRMGELATEIYKEFVSDGGLGRDFSAYLQRIEATS